MLSNYCIAQIMLCHYGSRRLGDKLILFYVVTGVTDGFSMLSLGVCRCLWCVKIVNR